MALIIYGRTTCALCGALLQDGELLFGTSGAFLPADDPLSRFCDAGMHWDCYAAWTERASFASKYFEARVHALGNNPYRMPVLLTDTCCLCVNPDIHGGMVFLLWAATGSELRVALDDWDSFLVSPGRWLTECHACEVAALTEILGLLRDQVPTPQRILAAIDWEGREAALERSVREQQEVREAQRKALQAYNAQYSQVKAIIQREGAACPHCGQQSTEYRCYDHHPERKWYFVCFCCGRSLHVEDFQHLLR